MKKKHIFQCFLLLFALPVMAQDERVYRKIFTGELGTEKRLEKKFKYVFRSKAYQYDLTDDGMLESIYVAKKDGLDYIEIKDIDGATLFESRLFNYGGNSNIYKITKTRISDFTNVMILHYYEGDTSGKKFEGTARLYLLSFDKWSKKWGLARGPHYWHEVELIKERYFQRPFQINVKDFNKDGIKEISVNYHHQHRVMTYLGGGKWNMH